MARPLINERAFLDPRLRAVDAYLRVHLSNPERLSLEQAARIAHVSPGHLCRMFQSRVGVPFIDWQCAVRLAEAKRLIVEQPLQLSAVGRTVGYEHYETFCRVFKRYEGISPRELRPFVLKYPELRSLVCSSTTVLVLRFGPLFLRPDDAVA